MSSIDIAKEIVRTSGNSFHSKVRGYLKSKGWHTLISPYYMDSSTNKAREIDLVAEKAFTNKDRWGRLTGTINIKLFIECKFVPKAVVFWLDDKNHGAARKLVTSTTPLKDDNNYTEKHHYLSASDKVAKLFAGENGREPENEVMYKALSQSLSAMVYNRGGGSIIPTNRNEYRVPVNRVIELPVLLCNSFENFYCTEMENSKEPIQVANNFLLEINYAYMDMQQRHRNEFFLIDVVSFDLIDFFLGQIDSDVDVIRFFMQ